MTDHYYLEQILLVPTSEQSAIYILHCLGWIITFMSGETR